MAGASVTQTQVPEEPRQEPDPSLTPTEEFDPPENTDDLETFADRVQAEEEANLAATTVERTVPIPAAFIMEQDSSPISSLSGVQEWISQTITFHVQDQDGALFLNTNEDPWTVEATLTGPGAFDTSLETSCTFAEDGYCSIEFALDQITTPTDLYTLTFTVTDANGDAVASVPVGTISDVEVDYKPMEVRFTTQPPTSVRAGGTYDVTLSFWDTVTDNVADTATVSLPSDISCELKIFDGLIETTIDTDTMSDTSKTIFFKKCVFDEN